MKVPRASITIVVCATAGSLALMTPAALADNGKSAFGCSNPFSLVHWDPVSGQLYFANGTPDPVTAAGLAGNAYTSAQLLTLWGILDHNGNKAICAKQPNGYTQDNKRIDYDNLTDDKILS